MRLLFIFLSHIITTTTTSQALVAWDKTFGGTNRDAAIAAFPEDSTYRVFMQSRSDDNDCMGNKGDWDAWMFLLDKQGNVLERKNYGGSKRDSPLWAVQTDNYEYIVSGITTSVDGDFPLTVDTSGIFVMKTGRDGNIRFSFTIPGTQGYSVSAVCYTHDHHVVIAGTARYGVGLIDTSYGLEDAFIAKFDTLGNLKWKQHIGGNEYDTGYKLTAIDSGLYAFTVSSTSHSDSVFNSINGQFNSYVFFIDDSGTIKNRFRYSGNGQCYVSGSVFKQSYNGNFVLVTNVYGLPGGDVDNIISSSDVWVCLVNAAGSIVKQKTYGGTYGEVPSDFELTTDGGVIVIAYTLSKDSIYPQSHGGHDIWVLKLDSALNLQWQICLGSLYREMPSTVKEVSEGTYIITGVKESSFLSNSSDAWVIVLQDSTFVSSIQSYNQGNLPVIFYPNPATTQLTLTIPPPTQPTTATITDVNGRLLRKEQLLNTTNTLNIDELPAGLYFIVVQNEEQRVMRRFVKQ